MYKKYAGFVPFKDEQNWWANFSDNCTPCMRCGLEHGSEVISPETGLRADCHAKVASAHIVVIEDESEDWCEERKQVEAWLLARGM